MSLTKKESPSESFVNELRLLIQKKDLSQFEFDSSFSLLLRLIIRMGIPDGHVQVKKQLLEIRRKRNIDQHEELFQAAIRSLDEQRAAKSRRRAERRRERALV